MITVDHMHFEIIENYRDAFDEEQFQEKYSEVLNKYDYIVGDIGYEKLRLAGFFRDNKAKVDRDKKFSAMQDYLYEYCNFGCAYFILRKVPKTEIKEMIENGELKEQSGEAEESSKPGSAETVYGEGAPDETTDEAVSEATSGTEAVTPESEPASVESGRQDESAQHKPEPKEQKQTQKQPQHKRKNQSRSRKKQNQQKQRQEENQKASNKTLAAHQSLKKS